MGLGPNKSECETVKIKKKKKVTQILRMETNYLHTIIYRATFWSLNSNLLILNVKLLNLKIITSFRGKKKLTL